MSTLIAVSIGIGFLTGISILVVASLVHAFRQEERSFPQTDESGR